MHRGRNGPLDLPSTEALIRGHLGVEEALFTTCGAWSTDPATSGGPAGAEVQAFFATQSALHGWRAAQWEERRPRSVGGPPGSTPGPGAGTLPGAWADALGAARDQPDGARRLACWVGALQPSLVARYRAHLRDLSPAADGGIARWLGIATDDALDGLADGAELLTRCVGEGQAGAVASAAGAAMAPLLGPS